MNPNDLKTYLSGLCDKPGCDQNDREHLVAVLDYIDRLEEALRRARPMNVGADIPLV